VVEPTLLLSISKDKKLERITFAIDNDKIVGNLHLPSGEGPFPTVITCGPMTSVKEQVTGTYASALAQHGIAALALDHRHYGESDGQPRQYECYPHKIEDLKTAINELAHHPKVDHQRMGAFGVCLGSGYLAHAIKNTKEIKAFVAVAGYYRDVADIRSSDPRGFDEKIAQGIAAREKFEATREVMMIPAVSLMEDAAMMLKSTYDYYSRRAAHPNYSNSFAIMSREYFLNFDVQSAAEHIQASFLMIHGPNALNPRWADKFFNTVPGTKEHYTISSEDQTDIYDNKRIVQDVSTKAADFLKKALHP